VIRERHRLGQELIKLRPDESLGKAAQKICEAIQK
jgi:hypothetical protein